MSETQPPPEQQELRNTLYRRVTRGQRRLTPARLMMYRVAVVVGWTVVRFFWRTCRIRTFVGLDTALATVRDATAKGMPDAAPIARSMSRQGPMQAAVSRVTCAPWRWPP